MKTPRATTQGVLNPRFHWRAGMIFDPDNEPCGVKLTSGALKITWIGKDYKGLLPDIYIMS